MVVPSKGTGKLMPELETNWECLGVKIIGGSQKGCWEPIGNELGAKILCFPARLLGANRAMENLEANVFL